MLATLAQFRKPLVDGGLELSEEICRVTFNGRPDPGAGKWFYAIHRGGLSGEQDGTDQRAYSIKITLSARIEEPFDRIGSDLLEAGGGIVSGQSTPDIGFDDRMDSIIDLMENRQYEIMNGANALIRTPVDIADPATNIVIDRDLNLFVEPLRYMGGDDDITPRQGAWWNAETEPNAGVSVTLRFGLARRFQYLTAAG